MSNCKMLHSKYYIYDRRQEREHATELVENIMMENVQFVKFMDVTTLCLIYTIQLHDPCSFWEYLRKRIANAFFFVLVHCLLVGLSKE